MSEGIFFNYKHEDIDWNSLDEKQKDEYFEEFVRHYMGMAFFNELIGNPLGLIFTTIVGILLMYLAVIPAAVMAIVGAGLAGVNIYVGSQMLISALEVKKNARNMHEYKKAAKLFAESITKIGINVLWLIISLVQTGKAIYEGKEIRITQKTKKYTTYEKSCLKELEKIENFTDSAIEHIFEGNINKRGKAGGYHYECIEDTLGRIISGTEVKLNDLGVYEAKVEVNTILKSGNGGYSTFFPKDMSPQIIIDSINEAYAMKVFKVGNEYYGYAKNGLKITMYIDKNGKIISAFPAK